MNKESRTFLEAVIFWDGVSRETGWAWEIPGSGMGGALGPPCDRGSDAEAEELEQTDEALFGRMRGASIGRGITVSSMRRGEPSYPL